MEFERIRAGKPKVLGMQAPNFEIEIPLDPPPPKGWTGRFEHGLRNLPRYIKLRTKVRGGTLHLLAPINDLEKDVEALRAHVEGTNDEFERFLAEGAASSSAEDLEADERRRIEDAQRRLDALGE